MKRLYIIESSTPGITTTRKRTTKTRFVYSGDMHFTVPDFKTKERIKQRGTYRGKRVIKVYNSGWDDKTYFIRHFL